MRHGTGLLVLFMMLGLLGNTARAADCERARALLEASFQRPIEAELATAQEAARLCEDSATLIYVAQVLAARRRWPEARAAYHQARVLAGMNLDQTSEIDMELADMMAAEQGATCEAVAAFQLADSNRRTANLPPPDWFVAKHREVESARSRGTLRADQIKCQMTTPAKLARANGDPAFQTEQDKLFCINPSTDIPLFFELNSALLKGQAREQVEEIAKAVKSLGQAGDWVRIDGHTDETGTDAFNQTLSEQRATSVIDALRKPLAGWNLEGLGHGSKEPKYPGHTDEDHRLNRRVEVSVVPARCHRT